MKSFVTIVALVAVLRAEPTESRSWTSVVGSKVVAQAIEMSGGKVTLLTSSGREIVLPLRKLVEKDQEYLREYFGEDDVKEESVDPDFELAKLDYPLGQVSGPIEVVEGVSYFLYLPKTLAAGAEAPVFFWTGSSKANRNHLHRFVDLGDIFGMVMAVHIEVGGSFTERTKQTKNCLDDLEKKFPVDIQRVVFSGGSAGGAVAWYNSSKLPCIGALPIIGYIPEGCRPTKQGLYCVMGGSWDYNRYSSAVDAKRFGKRAIHRIFHGGHAGGKEPEVQDGLFWLFTRHLYEGEGLEEERARTEPRIMKWIKTMAEADPKRAYWHVDQLMKNCDVSGKFGDEVRALYKKLGEDELNVRYVEARMAIRRFSEKHLASVGSGTKRGHTTDGIQRASRRLQKEYEDLPRILEIVKGLEKKTD